MFLYNIRENLKYIATGLFQKKLICFYFFLFEMIDSVGSAMEKGNMPYIFKLCEVKLKKDAWMVSVVDVTECRM